MDCVTQWLAVESTLSEAFCLKLSKSQETRDGWNGCPPWQKPKPIWLLFSCGFSKPTHYELRSWDEVSSWHIPMIRLRPLPVLPYHKTLFRILGSLDSSSDSILAQLHTPSRHDPVSSHPSQVSNNLLYNFTLKDPLASSKMLSWERLLVTSSCSEFWSL